MQKNAVPSLRSGLKSRKPSPLALEARLMFDGAAIATHAPDAAAPAPEAAVLERALPAERGVASVATEAAREGAQVIGRDGAPKKSSLLMPASPTGKARGQRQAGA